MKHAKIPTTAIFLFMAVLVSQPATAQSAGEGFRQEGTASWYGQQFEGRPTASGEIFDSSLFTAAHPTLPFGTFLMVTNRNNNRRISVRVNDRGPFVEGRIIDVSRAAAEHLGMLATGLAPVIIEVISAQGNFAPPAPVVLQTQPVAPTVAPPSVVQAGSATATVEGLSNAPPITINIYHAPPDASSSSVPEPQAPDPTLAWQQQSVPPQPQIEHPAYVDPPVAAVVPPSSLPLAPPTVAPTVAPPAAVAAPLPNLNPGAIYRVQVGSFKIARNAVDTFVRLRAADFDPAYERNGEFFRVVLHGIRGSDIPAVTQRLAALGHGDVLVAQEQ